MWLRLLFETGSEFHLSSLILMTDDHVNFFWISNYIGGQLCNLEKPRAKYFRLEQEMIVIMN
jgi:hypothetical protein